ncbi:hypothetical protein [Maliponia aquimaris]|uniref:Uncharacterized protein n=1 Tax=Maliponia aquimaris TaxID=1673631 RepID=A0A238KGB8_9RHOB|nr:hypothetical protein [Maliponia aquimaris]SMX41909.1 hypothetical protein MAA8898_02484 [Maliponia aquimaris]
MRWVRPWALRAGWLALALLGLVALRQGIAPLPFRAGGWLGSLAALVVLLAVAAPGQAARAVPAAALAVLLGGLVFTMGPQVDAFGPAQMFMAGCLAAAVLSALLCLGGGSIGERAVAGLIAAVLHLGLLHLLTPPGLTPPLALWPLAVPVLGAVWGLAAGAAR